jgi:hypothetical protein
MSIQTPRKEHHPGIGRTKFRTPDMLQDGLQNDGFSEVGCEPKPVRFFRIHSRKSRGSECYLALVENAQVFIRHILLQPRRAWFFLLPGANLNLSAFSEFTVGNRAVQNATLP